MNQRALILPASHINTSRWDDCVARNANGLIYASSTYLNAMADQWHGLVIGEYDAVMPIPWRMKWGFRYAYIPAFTQQMGLIGKYEPQDLDALLRTLPDFVSLADIHFNFSNTIPAGKEGFRQKNNLVLDLNPEAGTIAAGYKKNLQESLQKAISAGLYCDASEEVEIPVLLFRALYGRVLKKPIGTEAGRLVSLAKTLQAKDQCFVRNVYAASGELLAAALFLKDSRRIYNLVNAILPQGRERCANHYLLHSVISGFAGRELLFDFEGSEIPGVRQFFASFGAVPQPYPYYRYNGLPWPLHLLRK
ncbi:hypothetical protein [Sediminibacterium soli]|uniref:hypothetical protein n=1 Tax=Sediminibacterium soli TaxID=2698829 RepID=UPI00137955B5|nr:hypothetical protein [Sediminibacterium soli]NCI45628.1 hypothetical protein [Sediminibacterium soli]